jgi:hypothetical protein
MVSTHTVRVFFVVTLVVAAALIVQAQQQGQLYLTVLDPDGKPVKDVTVSDVLVTADEQPCTVIKVEPSGKPTRVSLMIDNGAATTRDMASLRAGYRAFLQALPEGIEVEILTTDPQPRWLEKPTTDRQKLLSAIDRISPESGSGAFFDALAEAANRADKDKGAYYPTFVVLAADVGRNENPLDWKIDKLQKQIQQFGITIHTVVFHEGSQTGTGNLLELGLGLTKLSGGRYEPINSATRFVTLFPELAQQVAKSASLQAAQFRVTYERPGKNGKAAQHVSASMRTARPGLHLVLSLNGHMPASTP